VIEKHFPIQNKLWIWLRGSGGFYEKLKILFLEDFFRIRALKSIRGIQWEFLLCALQFGYFNLEQRLFCKGSSYLMVFVRWRDSGKNPYFANPMDLPCFTLSGGWIWRRFWIFRFIMDGKSDIATLGVFIFRIHFGYLARFLIHWEQFYLFVLFFLILLVVSKRAIISKDLSQIMGKKEEKTTCWVEESIGNCARLTSFPKIFSSPWRNSLRAQLCF